jgi:hypothetical protein
MKKQHKYKVTHRYMSAGGGKTHTSYDNNLASARSGLLSTGGIIYKYDIKKKKYFLLERVSKKRKYIL